MTQSIKCAECHGTGIIEGYTNDGDYSIPFRDECIECDGNGTIETEIDDDDDDI
jgi:DnaJ-class molecular chaperone